MSNQSQNDSINSFETSYSEIADPMLRSDLQNLAGKLKRAIDNPIRLSMPIEVFERQWLPLFLTPITKEIEQSEIGGVPVMNWVNQITGNPYTWVDIIANGEVVYSVPPLLNRTGFKVNFFNFFHHVMEMDAMAAHGATPAEINAYRDYHITDRLEQDEEADVYLNEINKMAMYHGYKPFTTTLGVSGSLSEVNTDSGSGVGGYEDYSEQVERIDDF